jgi:DNA-binding MarR family transcriptional regulator
MRTKPTDSLPPPSSPVMERFMRAMFTQIITALARSLRTQNLSVAEIAALHLIDREKTLRVSDLAVLLDADLPAASRTASRLVSEGLVDRQEDPDDRRARLLTLTAAGHALIERTSRERVQTAIATARSMPGAVVDTIAPAMQQLIGLGKKPGKTLKPK